jgi:DNA-binding NtrC family response regulator
VQRAAPTNATVMLLGESGVGKELVARTIHRNSPRAGQRFIQVNCAAIPEELIESELFGHEKGSFTGRDGKQIGKFEQADRGTIFLDEVGDMSAKTQAKVLARPAGAGSGAPRLGAHHQGGCAGDSPRPTRISKTRSRAASFGKTCTSGLQRHSDSRARRSAERREDIPALVQHFAKLTSEEHNLKPKRFDPRAMEALQRYRWRWQYPRSFATRSERVMIMAPGDLIRRRGPSRPRFAAMRPAARSPQTRPPPRKPAAAAAGPSRARHRRPARCESSRKPPNAPSSLISSARTIGIFRRPPKPWTRRGSNLYKKLELYGIKQEIDG